MIPRMFLPVSIRITAAALFLSALSLFVAFPAPLRMVAGLLLSYVLPGIVFFFLSPLVAAWLAERFEALVGWFEPVYWNERVRAFAYRDASARASGKEETE